MSENIELPDEPENVLIDDNELDIDALDESEPKPETVQQNEEDGQQEEDEAYGKKVQKRINKLVAQRNVEREENRQLRDRVGQLEEKFTASDHKRESREINDKVAEIKKRKMAFMDEGEYEKAEDLNDELFDLKIEQRNKPKQVEREAPQTPQIPEAQQAWVDSNEWYGSNAQAPKAQYANALYQEIVNEGYDPDDADTYSELDKRLDNTNPQNKPVRKPPGQIPPDRGSVSGSSTQVKFTQRDVNTMREYGLDPNDPAQRKEWLNNKRG